MVAVAAPRGDGARLTGVVLIVCRSSGASKTPEDGAATGAGSDAGGGRLIAGSLLGQTEPPGMPLRAAGWTGPLCDDPKPPRIPVIVSFDSVTARR